jgi:hypothetical protein
MQVPVLVQSLKDRPGYLARLGSPFDLSAEGATSEEALRELTSALLERLRAGDKVLLLNLPPASSPGWLPDDELTREWLQAVETYRQECDEADRGRILGEAAVPREAS